MEKGEIFLFALGIVALVTVVLAIIFFAKGCHVESIEKCGNICSSSGQKVVKASERECLCH